MKHSSQFGSVAVALLLLAACGGSNEPPAPKGAGQSQPAQTAAPAPAVKATVVPVKSCSLFTKAEIEAATGRKVLDPVEEQTAELSICTYGDPEAPTLAGRPLSQVVRLSVFTGGSSYYAGPVAQAKAIYEMVEKNAGRVEVVSGLGEKAHWAGKTLRAVRGPYMVEVEVDVGDGSRKIAEQLLKTALDKIH